MHRSRTGAQIEQQLWRVLQAPEAALPSHPRAPRQVRMFTTPTQITFTDDSVQNRTILELIAGDRPGLLSEIGKVFLAERIDVATAKIMTIGERAEDVFFVTDHQGRALSEAARRRLQDQLFESLDRRVEASSPEWWAGTDGRDPPPCSRRRRGVRDTRGTHAGARPPEGARRSNARSTCSTPGSFASRKNATVSGASMNGSRRPCCCPSGCTTTAWPMRATRGSSTACRSSTRSTPTRGSAPRCAGRPARRGAARRLRRAERGADAELRQRRRLDRRRLDGRYLGYRGFLRADRPQRAFVGRRRGIVLEPVPRRPSSRTTASSAHARKSSRASSSSRAP